MKIRTTDITSYGVGFEPTIAPGTTAQYWRGDKTWQTLPAPGISDAPSDGNTYGRLNAAWTNLNLNQYAQLSGATFTGGVAMSGVLTIGAASNPQSLINVGVYGSVAYDSSAVTTIFGQNFYYSGGYKARVNGQAAGMRFGNPGVEFFYNSSVTANTAFTPNITATFNNASANFTVPIGLGVYAKASLPSAATVGQMIFVTDDVGGSVPAFSDGTNWRRVTDRNVIS